MIHTLIDFPLQIVSIKLITLHIAGMLWGVQDDKKKGIVDRTPI